MKQLIVASGNAHKVEEFDSLLDDCGFEVLSAKVCGGMPDVLEDGDTFGAVSYTHLTLPTIYSV